MRKNALVTGASSGIGLELASELGTRGYHIVCIASGEEKLAEAIQLLHKKGYSAEYYVCDLSNVAERQGLIAEFSNRDPIHFLANNAGIGMLGPFLEVDYTTHQNICSLNIDAVQHLCHAFGKTMQDNRYGYIINVASVAGFLPGPDMASYFASKAAVISFSLALREELKSSSVHVTALCPGITKTSFFERAQCQQNFLKAPSFLIGDARVVARDAINAVNKNEAICIPGKLNKIAVRLAKSLPSQWLSALSHR